MAYDKTDEPCKRRGYSQQDSKEFWKTILGLMDAEDRKRTSPEDDAMDTSETVAEIRNWAPVRRAANLGKSRCN